MKRTAKLAVLHGVLCTAALAQDPQSQSVGAAEAPAVVRDNLADRVYDAARMDRARALLADEHGGDPVSKVMGNLVEYASTSEGSGYRWDVEAWYGGDHHRFVFKTEGDGLRRGTLAAAEVQGLYSRSVGRYTDVQAGVRYELEPDARPCATIAVESLLPYWFKVQAALFWSDRGDVFSRLESSYDMQATQRLVLQPRLEVSLAAQDVPDIRIGSGFSSAELGLRLRYEIRREIAPYVGVSFEKQLGGTADLVRASGGKTEDTSVVIGLRAWF